MNIDWHSSSLTRFTIVDKDYKKTHKTFAVLWSMSVVQISGLIASLWPGYEMTYKKIWVMWLMSGSADIHFHFSAGTSGLRS